MNVENRGWHEEEIGFNHPYEAVPVPIVRDGMIKSPAVADGGFVPAVILDTSTRQDVANMLLEHLPEGPGQCSSSWGRKQQATSDQLHLILQFTKPIPSVVILEFDLNKHTALIDKIIQSGHLYLFSGEPGDKLSDPSVLNNSPSILVEVPSPDFKPEWEEIYDLHLEKKGLSKKQIQELKNKFRAL